MFLPDNQMFQYFITIVPTKLETYKVTADTHQYSVTERVGSWKQMVFVLQNHNFFFFFLFLKM